MNQRKRRFGFTLLELLVTMTLFFVVIAMVSRFYVYIAGVKRGLEGRQILIENGYYMLERLQVQMKNYSIDYEEYFNRRSVGCDTPTLVSDLSDFAWNVNSTTPNGYCDQFTYYGNRNSSPDSAGPNEHSLYYCSSVLAGDELTAGGYPYAVVASPLNLRAGDGCFSDVTPVPSENSFGQYSRHFYDANDNVDTVLGALLDDDDEDLGSGPEAIGDPEGVQELYLISPDKEQRIFFRRALVDSGDRNGDSLASTDNEKLYTIQMLKLQGFDVGNDHDLSFGNDDGLYDGKIDTWACDVQRGFSCQGDSLGSFYAAYHLPADQNDGWIPLFSNDITIPERNLVLYPTKDPSLAWAEDDMQISPYMQISFQTKLYGEDWLRRIGPSVENYSFSLQTTFTMGNFYGK